MHFGNNCWNITTTSGVSKITKSESNGYFKHYKLSSCDSSSEQNTIEQDPSELEKDISNHILWKRITKQSWQGNFILIAGF